MAIPALTEGDVYPVQAAVRIDFTEVSTTPQYDYAGAPVETNKGPAIYAKIGTGGVAAGDYVAFTQSTTTGIITATKEDTTSSGANPRQGGIAIATGVATSWAWFLTGPFDMVPVNVANSVSSGAALTTTGSAGQLGAGGDTVVGAYLLEASGASGLTAASAATSLGTNF